MWKQLTEYGKRCDDISARRAWVIERSGRYAQLGVVSAALRAINMLIIAVKLKAQDFKTLYVAQNTTSLAKF